MNVELLKEIAGIELEYMTSQYHYIRSVGIYDNFFLKSIYL